MRHLNGSIFSPARRSCLLAVTTVTPAAAQAPSEQARATEADHAQMMQQLGITQLRKGPNGDATAPDHANYDESLANPYPDYPDPLRMNDGSKVTTAAQWNSKRRPQIIEELRARGARAGCRRIRPPCPSRSRPARTNASGRFPSAPTLADRASRQLRRSEHHRGFSRDADQAGQPRRTDAAADHVCARYPALSVTRQPLPGGRGPHERRPARRHDQGKPRAGGRLQSHPAWQPIPTPPFFPAPRPPNDPISQLVAAGWAVAQIDPTAVQADNGAGLTRGVIGLVNKGQPRKPDDWGALRAWAWGASRGTGLCET